MVITTVCVKSAIAQVILSTVRFVTWPGILAVPTSYAFLHTINCGNAQLAMTFHHPLTSIPMELVVAMRRRTRKDDTDRGEEENDAGGGSEDKTDGCDGDADGEGEEEDDSYP
jgi:hypothetical protein